MPGFSILLGGLLVWTAHFFLLYGIASVWGTSSLSRWLTVAATIVALAAQGLILRHISRRSSDSRSQRWVLRTGALMTALAMLATLWQGLPALLA